MHNWNTTVLVKLASQDKTDINFDEGKELTNYYNHAYAYNRELIKILTNHESCNKMEHFLINKKW